MTVWVAAVGLVLLAVGIDRLALWMEARGWINWRRSGRRGSASLWLVEEIYQPSMVHVHEEEVRERTEADQDETGGE